ncbi:hypothetical protein CCP3SC1_130005 [Gammaproteobacteria bacterium]
MLEMDGYEATHRIRELAPDLTIIGLTTRALVEDRRCCLRAGILPNRSWSML